MDSFSERLKALGFKVASGITEPVEKHHSSLEKAISGKVMLNSLGEYVLKVEVLSAGHLHGNVFFPEDVSTYPISSAVRLDGQTPDLSDLIFLDTETSGLAAGAGSFAFLVGIGRFVAEGFELRQYIIRDPSEENAMLLDLSNLISPSSVFVTFNGKSFDIPLLESRYRINRLPVTLRANPHIDILQLARKVWRSRLASCALKDLEKEIIQFKRTDDDIPGWMIPDIYFEYLRSGKNDKLTNVIYHNAQDVISLAALFIHLTKLMENQHDFTKVNPADQFSIAKIFLETGKPDVAEKICIKLLSSQLPERETIEISKFLAYYYKRSSDHDKAEIYWKNAAQYMDIGACIELAKLAEHQKKVYQEALYWAKIARQNMLNSGDTTSEVKIARRIERLVNKEKRNVQPEKTG